MKRRILITGITGFLGSHIAERFIDSDDWDVYATKRKESSLHRVSSFSHKINWIDINSPDWKKDIIKINPEFIINSAWSGVGANGRDDWNVQIANISFQQELLEIALECSTMRFIGVGSQAEYGEFNEIITEAVVANPTTAYGATKLASLDILKVFCNKNNIDWTWFRVFSVFGEKEGGNWLIPATIKNILTQDSMDFTSAEQKYSYMYVKDVAEIFFQSCNKCHPNGVYNISSKNPVKLKEVITCIQQQLNPDFKLNFGALPYRPNQSMLNQGDVSKLEKYISLIDDDLFHAKLAKVIASYVE